PVGIHGCAFGRRPPLCVQKLRLVGSRMDHNSNRVSASQDVSLVVMRFGIPEPPLEILDEQAPVQGGLSDLEQCRRETAQTARCRGCVVADSVSNAYAVSSGNFDRDFPETLSAWLLARQFAPILLIAPGTRAADLPNAGVSTLAPHRQRFTGRA